MLRYLVMGLSSKFNEPSAGILTATFRFGCREHTRGILIVWIKLRSSKHAWDIRHGWLIICSSGQVGSSGSFQRGRRLGEGSRRIGCRLTKAARWGGGSHPIRCRTVTNRQITRRYWKRLKPGNQHHCKTRYHCSVVAQYTKRHPSF